jgi:DNA invertase Pin-like site-specific DNA recombinase
MLAFGYDRVSTQRQAKTVNLDKRYREAMAQLCERRVWTLRRIYTDPGLTGRNAQRPGLHAAIEAVIKHKGVLVFYDLSRLSRSLKDAVTINEQLRAGGCGMCSCTDPIDTSDDNPAGEFTFHIIAACAQFESRLKGGKVKYTNAQTVAELGYRTQGRQPLGYRIVGRERVACEEELVIIDKAKSYLTLYGPREGAKRLNADGVPTIAKLRGWAVGLKWTGGGLQHYKDHAGRVCPTRENAAS